MCRVLVIKHKKRGKKIRTPRRDAVENRDKTTVLLKSAGTQGSGLVALLLTEKCVKYENFSSHNRS